MIIEIPLTQDQVALVPDDDHEWVSVVKWFAKWNQATRSFYAARNVSTGMKHPKQRTLRMHRVIWEHHNGPIPDGFTVDHADRNSLNNCPSNLRLATRTQQCQNQGLRSDNKSGYRGVSWWRRSEKWLAQIRVDGKLIYLGLYDDPIAAARAYDAAAIEHFGEFAVLNFPQEVLA